MVVVRTKKDVLELNPPGGFLTHSSPVDQFIKTFFGSFKNARQFCIII